MQISPRVPIVSLGVAGALALAAGCAGPASSAADARSGPRGPALTSQTANLPDDAAPPEDVERQIRETAAMLEGMDPDLLANAHDRAGDRAHAEAARTPITQIRPINEPSLALADIVDDEAAGSGSIAANAGAERGVSGGVSESAAPASPEDRRAVLVDELTGLLREIGSNPDERYRAALALTGLEVLSPGAVDSLVTDGALLPSEAAVLDAAKTLFSEMASGDARPGAAMDVLDEVTDRLNERAPITISAAALCTRVSGFGQYDTFDPDDDGGYTFIAGRRQPLIVYVEVDRFARKPVVAPDGSARWEIALSQELQIYHEGDELMVTRTSPETDHTITRSRMRDYYLINQTALPETLGAGRYILKIIMRDENKDAVAETTVPIRLVAGRSAISRGG